MPATILDFDLTITKEHTFSSCNLDLVPLEIRGNAEVLINFGAMHAKTNLRLGAKGHFLFSFAESDIFAIATHHNNPDFIAGYVQEILEKRVTLKSKNPEIYAFPGEGRIGIKNYAIDGIAKPLLIAYIPEGCSTFSSVRMALHGKNEMIISLLNKWQALDLWPQNMVSFYDDDKRNIDFARECRLPESRKMLVHHVDTSTMNFAGSYQ